MKLVVPVGATAPHADILEAATTVTVLLLLPATSAATVCNLDQQEFVWVDVVGLVDMYQIAKR